MISKSEHFLKWDFMVNIVVLIAYSASTLVVFSLT